jgi:tripartite-type tricarboxylate transporter receptor subunit TctC
MKPTRRSLVLSALAAPLAGSALTRAARADTWPSGIIKIIVPFPPGGSVDRAYGAARPATEAQR